MRQVADIVVIGAGIQGASAAYHISSRLRDVRVVVVERARDPGAGATAATAAMIMHQTDDEHLTRLARISIQRYRSLADQIGEIGLRETGSILFSADSSNAVRLEALAHHQQALGINTEIISGEDAERLSRGLLRGADILTASYCRDDGYVDPQRVVCGYLAAAQEHGAELLTETHALSIEVNSGGEVSGVQLGGGDMLTTACVVNCAGAQARDLGLSAGVDLPIKRNHRNMLLMEATLPHHRAFPIIEDVDTEWYFRQHDEGVLLGIGPTRWLDDGSDQPEPSYDPSYEIEAGRYLQERAPSLAPLKKLRGWGGSRPMIDPAVQSLYGGADGLPIIGGVPHVSGYYHSCGWGAFGVTLAPIGGELVAQVLCGEKTTVDIAPFGWERFFRHPVAERLKAA